MTDKKRRAYRLLLALLLLWGAHQLFTLYQIHFPNRSHPMIPLLQDLQTFCVGNYLIDLPRGSVPTRLETDLEKEREAKFFAYPGRSRRSFQNKVIDRWEAIKDWKQDGTIIFDQPSQRFDIMPDGVVMTFRHRTKVGDWFDGTSGPKSFYETEGYLWRDGTLYEFKIGSSKDTLINAMRTLQVRQDDEIPVAQGFCGGRSFFPGKPDPMDYVSFTFRLPIDTNTVFVIDVPTGQSPRPDLSRWQSDDIKIKTLRQASRTQASLEGSEWMTYDWQRKYDDDASAEYETTLSATWFGHDKNLSLPPPVPGMGFVGPDDGFPGVKMKLDADISVRASSPPKVGEMIAPEGQAPLTVEEFTALWDGIVSSLRLRPVLHP
jgi:hypothetical protein